jgi:hypothetical protein
MHGGKGDSRERGGGVNTWSTRQAKRAEGHTQWPCPRVGARAPEEPKTTRKKTSASTLLWRGGYVWGGRVHRKTGRGREHA